MFQWALPDFHSPIFSFHRSSQEPQKEKQKSNRTRSICSFQAFSSRGKTQERSFIHSQWSFQPNIVLWPLQCCVCSSPVAQTPSPLPLPAAHFEIIHLQRLQFIFQHLSAALGATQTGPSANTGGTATSKGWLWWSEFPSSPDGESAAKLARVTFIEETKAKAGSFPKPLHRDIHLLHFWITGYRTRGKNLPGPIQSSYFYRPQNTLHCHSLMYALHILTKMATILVFTVITAVPRYVVSVLGFQCPLHSKHACDIPTTVLILKRRVWSFCLFSYRFYGTQSSIYINR